MEFFSVKKKEPPEDVFLILRTNKNKVFRGFKSEFWKCEFYGIKENNVIFRLYSKNTDLIQKIKDINDGKDYILCQGYATKSIENHGKVIEWAIDDQKISHKPIAKGTNHAPYRLIAESIKIA